MRVLEPHLVGAAEAERLQPIAPRGRDREAVEETVARRDCVARGDAGRKGAAIRQDGPRRGDTHVTMGVALGGAGALIRALAATCFQQEVPPGAVVGLAIER